MDAVSKMFSVAAALCWLADHPNPEVCDDVRRLPESVARLLIEIDDHRQWDENRLAGLRADLDDLVAGELCVVLCCCLSLCLQPTRREWTKKW